MSTGVKSLKAIIWIDTLNGSGILFKDAITGETIALLEGRTISKSKLSELVFDHYLKTEEACRYIIEGKTSSSVIITRIYNKIAFNQNLQIDLLTEAADRLINGIPAKGTDERN